MAKMQLKGPSPTVSLSKLYSPLKLQESVRRRGLLLDDAEVRNHRVGVRIVELVSVKYVEHVEAEDKLYPAVGAKRDFFLYVGVGLKRLVAAESGNPVGEHTRLVG